MVYLEYFWCIWSIYSGVFGVYSGVFGVYSGVFGVYSGAYFEYIVVYFKYILVYLEYIFWCILVYSRYLRRVKLGKKATGAARVLL